MKDAMATNAKPRIKYKGGRIINPDFASLYPCSGGIYFGRNIFQEYSANYFYPSNFDKLNELRNVGREINQFVQFNLVVENVKPVFSKMMINSNTQKVMEIEQMIFNRRKNSQKIKNAEQYTCDQCIYYQDCLKHDDCLPKMVACIHFKENKS